MLRPLIVVARPADWTGSLARWATTAATLLLMVPVVLARLPQAWVELAGGYPEIVRGIAALVVLWLMSWVRAVVYSRLPAAPYLVGKTLVFPERGRKRRLRVNRIAEVHVELRPPPVHQAFVIELKSGSVHELCPVDWEGAGRLYAKLARRVR